MTQNSMYLIKIFGIIALLLTLSSCSWWPDHGRGGAAELRTTTYRKHGHAHASFVDNFNLRLKNTRDTMERLHNRNAAVCFPGLWYEARLLDNRITREIADKLYIDAYNDVTILDKHIVTIKKQMAKVRNPKTCR